MKQTVKFLNLTVFSLIIYSFLILPSVATADSVFETFLAAGESGDPVPNPSINVDQLQDNAYTYTSVDCVVNDYEVSIDNYVTIVVIDDGLTPTEWRALEQNPEANLNIIGFLTYTQSNEIRYITNPDDTLLDRQCVHGHGFAVLSVIAAIARNVKVIFVDLKATKNSVQDTFGFPYGSSEFWNWIDNNQASKDIDIISWSCTYWVDFATQTIHQKWQNLLDKDVIMFTAAGNKGNYLNHDSFHEFKYQSYYSEWYSVGSIDHENRGGSYKDHRSWFSSWYESYTSGNHIVNWLMPGNGIPTLTNAYYDTSIGCYRGDWVYGAGTSFSTPYLAAVAALIITGYHKGIGNSTDPSLQKVIDILLYASSRSTFDQKMGYGYIDVYMAYGKAYTEGRLDS